jgi:hypothetical protein
VALETVAIPAAVRTSHSTTTSRLCARDQRVTERIMATIVSPPGAAVVGRREAVALLPGAPACAVAYPRGRRADYSRQPMIARRIAVIVGA